MDPHGPVGPRHDSEEKDETFFVPRETFFDTPSPIIGGGFLITLYETINY